MNVIIPKTTNQYEKQNTIAKKAENICKKLMTVEEQKIMNENYDAANKNCDAVCLYILFKKFGFTAEQLKEYFDEVTATMKAEIKADVYRASYGKIPQLTALKDEVDVDLEVWYEEAELNGGGYYNV